jgi:Glycosyl transferase family 21
VTRRASTRRHGRRITREKRWRRRKSGFRLVLPPVALPLRAGILSTTSPTHGRTLRLSAVIPATDGPATLGRCLEGILDAEAPPEEVIVVDSPPRSGPAAARNAGAAEATNSVLVFVDSDVVVRSDVFFRIRLAFAADPDLVAMFGSYDDAPSPHGDVSTFRNLLHHHMHQRSGGEASTFWAGLGAIRRDALLAAGGFDAERYPVPSVEDIELGLRLHAAGARIRLDPNVQGNHLKRWRVRDMVVTDLLHRGVPWTGLLLEHGLPSASLNTSLRHRLSAAAFAGAVGAAATGRPRLAALLTAGFLRLNLRFYTLLLRRGGPRAAIAGVGLHVLHSVTALAAAPIGAALFSVQRSRPPEVGAYAVPGTVGTDGRLRRRRRFLRASGGTNSHGAPQPDAVA